MSSRYRSGKEDLRQLWEQPNMHAARSKLLDWYHQAMASGVRVLRDFARLLLERQEGILAWYDYPISPARRYAESAARGA